MAGKPVQNVHDLQVHYVFWPFTLFAHELAPTIPHYGERLFPSGPIPPMFNFVGHLSNILLQFFKTLFVEKVVHCVCHQVYTLTLPMANGDDLRPEAVFCYAI